jgi:hypothetical protein
VEEKPADEFPGGKGHRFLLAFVSVVLPSETHLTSFDVQQAIVRDRDADPDGSRDADSLYPGVESRAYRSYNSAAL